MPRRRRRYVSWEQPPPPRRSVNRCRALLVIDNRPLQAAAWAELVRARKRLEKATRDVHRHEEADEPAFHAWIARTFPTLISAARELAQQVEAKSRIVDAIESESFFSGRAPSRIWHAWQQNGGQPPAPPPPPPDHPASKDYRQTYDAAGPEEPLPDLDDVLEEEMKRMFGEDGVDENDPAAGAFRDFARDVFGFGGRSKPAPDEAADAREIYRRLVRHLHPDRGGEWTPARARLWEQVQTAWAACDADWLARLEAEWEAAADLLGLASPVGRLRAALAEIDAARRDAEKRVRKYRKDPAWRFSLQPPPELLREQMHRQLLRETTTLRSQLDELETVIASWERTGSRRRSKRRREAPQQCNFQF
jgi:hypothetical protein